MAYKLLLIDKGQILQNILELILQSEGFEINLCSDETKIDEYIKTYPLNIIVINAANLEFDSYQLCKRIKHNVIRNTPIMFVCSVFEPFNKSAARLAEVDDFITKPFSPKDFIEKIKSLMNKNFEDSDSK